MIDWMIYLMKIDCLMIGKKSKTNQVWHVVIVKWSPQRRGCFKSVNAFSDNVEQYAVERLRCGWMFNNWVKENGAAGTSFQTTGKELREKFPAFQVSATFCLQIITT